MNFQRGDGSASGKVQDYFGTADFGQQQNHPSSGTIVESKVLEDVALLSHFLMRTIRCAPYLQSSTTPATIGFQTVSFASIDGRDNVTCSPFRI